MLGQAHRTLQLLTTTAGRIEDPGVRRSMVRVAEAVGESIVTASSTAAAIIALSDANDRLLTATVALAQHASRMGARNAQTNGSQ
jgi:hypothetical protein